MTQLPRIAQVLEALPKMFVQGRPSLACARIAPVGAYASNLREPLQKFWVGLLLFGGSLSHVWGADVSIQWTLDQEWRFLLSSKRTGIDRCWVRMHPNPNEEICVPRGVWNRWILGGWGQDLSGAVWMAELRVLVHEASLNPKHLNPDLKLERRMTLVSPLDSKMDPSKHAPRVGQQTILYLMRRLELFRESLSDRFLPFDRYGVLRQLILNQGVPEIDSSLLRRLGLVHVYTLAGLHLLFFAIWLQRFWFGSLNLLAVPHQTPMARRLGWLLQFGFWGSAVLIQGYRPGLLRPLIVILLRSGFRKIGIRMRLLGPLVLSLGLDTMIRAYRYLFLDQPLWAPGSLHYALAVGGGVLAYDTYHAKNKSGFRNHLRGHMAMAIGSWLPIALLDCLEFHSTALLTPFLSLISVPLISYGVLVAWVPGMGHLLSQAMNGLIQGLFQVPNLILISPMHLGIGMALATGVLWILKGKRQWGALVGILLVLLVGSKVYSQHPGRRSYPRVLQLPVGQGDATLIRSDQGVSLLDVGPTRAHRPSDWLNYLTHQGITTFNQIGLTHLDWDHAGGLGILTRLIPINEIVTSDLEWNTARGQRLSREILSRNNGHIRGWLESKWPWPVLAPNPASASKGREGNQFMSATLIPISPGKYYLNAGDSDFKNEDRVAHWARDLLFTQGGQVQILKVSHHGSAYSTDHSFLEAVRPKVAWISVGARNHYGHPTQRALGRLKAWSLQVFRTDRSGVLDSSDFLN